MTIWRMRFTCWILKTTNTLTEYVILTAFTRQQWLYERTSVLRYMYMASHDIPLISLGICWHNTFKRLLSLPPRPVFSNQGSVGHDCGVREKSWKQ